MVAGSLGWPGELGIRGGSWLDKGRSTGWEGAWGAEILGSEQVRRDRQEAAARRTAARGSAAAKP